MIFPINGRGKILCAPIDKVGGGGGILPARFIKPNLALINRLRIEAKLEIIEAALRPTEIRNVAFIDDEPGTTKVLSRLVGLHIRNLTKKEIGKFNPNEISPIHLAEDKFNICTGNSTEEIIAVQDLILNPEAKIDLLITDFDMGGISGREVAKYLRAKGCEIFIIGLTGGGSSNIEALYQAGADLVYNKPFENEKITGLFI